MSQASFPAPPTFITSFGESLSKKKHPLEWV